MMDKNCLFSTFSLLAVLIYLYVGFYTFKQNKKSLIHRIFLLLCLSYAIWSFAYAFAYISVDQATFSKWNKIAAIGWCSFSAITLFLVLHITENKMILKRGMNILIFLPAVVFFYMAVFLFGENITTSPVISTVFYIGDFLYNFIYLLISIICILLWGLKSTSIRIKKQCQVLVLASVIPFTLNLLTQTILPRIGITHFPLMGQLYSVIMIIGTYIVITKYKFLRIPERFIFEEVANEMMDMIIVLDGQGMIIRISNHTMKLLGYESGELIKKKMNLILDERDANELSIDAIKQENMRYYDIHFVTKNGNRIPVNISSVRIFDSYIPEIIGIVLIIQDISMIYELQRINQELQERAIRDGLTQLYNHQHTIELLHQEADIARIEHKKLTVMMLDLDFFKKVNDRYGHFFGDQVLEAVSHILLKNVSLNGHVGRFGGEEFILILPGIVLQEACTIGDRIKNEVSELSFNNGLKITVSIGIKQLKDETPDELIKTADGLLYKAKQNGRNRIEYSA